MKNRSENGSVIVLAMIFGTVAVLAITYLGSSLATEYKTTVRYGLGYTAFHLSESGVELAMYAITNEELGDSDWPSTGDQTWTFTDNTPVGQYASNTRVRVINNGDGSYLITALGSVDLGSNPVQRAVETVVQQGLTEEQEEDGTGSGAFDYGLVAKDAIKLNHNNPGMKIASYDSDVDFGVPEFGVNTGFDVTVATPSTTDNAIKVNNAYITGSIRSGGGSIDYSNSHPHDPFQNAIVLGPDSTQAHGVDLNRLSIDFDGEVPDPDLPTQEGYNVLSFDQNYWQNNQDIEIGSTNSSTWVSTERVNTNAQGTLTIRGEVVIDAQRNLNLAADIVIEPGATLIVMAGENIHVNASSIAQQYPSQFQLIAKSNRDVVLNNFDVFTGVVNAPNSNVRLAGVGGTPKSQFRGAVIGKNIEVTNGTEFYYDVNLGDGGFDNSEDGGLGTVPVGELELVSWAEVSPSRAFD
ncbi:MAG: hypothetical protein AAFX93_04985 [Verrucomicrobiota bacterium]